MKPVGGNSQVNSSEVTGIKVTETFAASLDYPTFKGALTLSRAPKFLRFTVAGPLSKGSWDALDQLDDVAQPEEQVFAARLIRKGTVHIDRVVKRKRVGEWITTAEYKMLDDGPPESVLRDGDAWRAWCLQRDAEEKAGN